MQYRDHTTVQSWVTDFLETHPEVGARISVLEQYYTEGPETALVVVQLRTASTLTAVEPLIEDGRATWRVRFEAREDVLNLDSEQTERLAADLTVLAQLCRHLQERTEAAA